ELMRTWEGERSNYIVIGSVLQPPFKEQLERGEITEFLRRCAAFMEKICNDGDIEAINVIWVRIFEWLLFRPKELQLIWPILGPATRGNLKDAASRWSKAGRYFGKTLGLPCENIPRD